MSIRTATFLGHFRHGHAVVPDAPDRFAGRVTGFEVDRLNLKAGDQTVSGSNLGKDMRYDQIHHMPTLKKRFTNAGGTVDFHISDARIKELFPDKTYTRDQFSFQISDHFPVWVQLKTDIDGERFNQIVQNARKT